MQKNNQREASDPYERKILLDPITSSLSDLRIFATSFLVEVVLPQPYRTTRSVTPPAITALSAKTIGKKVRTDAPTNWSPPARSGWAAMNCRSRQETRKRRPNDQYNKTRTLEAPLSILFDKTKGLLQPERRTAVEDFTLAGAICLSHFR
jgi:hypothetical protein